MFYLITCYYTNSNELNPVGVFVTLLSMVVFIIFAIVIWTGNKVNDYKYNQEKQHIEKYLTDEALKILHSESKVNAQFNKIWYTTNWRQWFVKGYIHGARNYNRYYSPYAPSKKTSEFTIDEWEDYELQTMQHIKFNSDYFGGNKEIAIFAFFQGHKYGCIRYSEKGEAK